MSDDDSRHATIQAVVGWGMVAAIGLLTIVLLGLCVVAFIGAMGW